MSTSGGSISQNIILNHDFSQGMSHWKLNNCKANVVRDQEGTYAILTERRKYYSCLEQNIKKRVFEGRRYKASAWVRICGSALESDLINAKLKVRYSGSDEYKNFKGFKTTISEGNWWKLEGVCKMPPFPDGKMLFYIFGPQPGVDLHIKMVELTCLDATENEVTGTSGGTATNAESGSAENNEILSTSHEAVQSPTFGLTPRNQNASHITAAGAATNTSAPVALAGTSGSAAANLKPVSTINKKIIYGSMKSPQGENIIQNHDFSLGLSHWETHYCQADVLSIGDGTFYANIRSRKGDWSRLQQDVLGRASGGRKYKFSALIRLSCPPSESYYVKTKLQPIYSSSRKYKEYISTEAKISGGEWMKFEHELMMPALPDRKMLFYINGPAREVDIHLKSVELFCLDTSEMDETCERMHSSQCENIIKNHDFSQGLSEWETHYCEADVVSNEDGTYYANIRNRKADWSRVQQDVMGRVSGGRKYKLSASVRLSSPSSRSHYIKCKLKPIYSSSRMYQEFSSTETEISGGEWKTLEQELIMPALPDRQILFYINGPAREVDIHLKSVELFCLDTSEREIPSISEHAATNPISGSRENNETPRASGNAAENMKPGITGSNQIGGDHSVNCCNCGAYSVSTGATGSTGESSDSCSRFATFVRGLLCCSFGL